MNNFQKFHIRQQGRSDCGVACLRAILRRFGSDASLEELRDLSGTSRYGTSMLGLHQAATHLGLKTDAYESDLKSLSECTDVCLLHVVIEDRLQHYIVYHGYHDKSNKFIIGDPGKSTVECYTHEELGNIWESNTLLLFKPGPKLKKVSLKQNGQWQWLRRFIRKDWNILGVALALGIAVATLGLSTAIFSQKLIDDILPGKDHIRLFAGIGLLGFLLIIKSILGYLRQLFLAQQSKDFNTRIINFFYESLLYLPKSFFDNRKTGELVARMNDTNRIQRAVSQVVSSFMIDILIAIAATIAIFSYHWTIGLVAILWLPIFGFIVWYFHPKIVKGQKEVMKTYAFNESNYVDTIQGVSVIKITNKQGVFSKITKTIYGLFQQAIFRLAKVGLSYNLITEIIGTIFLTVLILWSSLLVLEETLSVGAIMAILQMISMIMTSGGRLALTNIQLQEAKVAFERMHEFTSVKQEFLPNQDNRRLQLKSFNKLKVSNLSFGFPGRNRLLEDISFELQKGEMITLLGESGCGKSTLLQILQKFYFPNSGNIEINNYFIQDISYQNWRSFLAVVPQQIKLFNGTVLDNILLEEGEKDTNSVIQFLNDLGFEPYFAKFPNGYSTIVGEEGVNISGGQQQLVALARALYQRPQLLLLDEPTAAMDRKMEAFVFNLLNQLKQEMGILLVTHRITTAAQSNCIYVIENKSIISYGKHDDLLKNTNLYSDTWEQLQMLQMI